MAEDSETSGDEGGKTKRFGLMVLIAGVLGGLAVGGAIMYFLNGSGGEPTDEQTAEQDAGKSANGQESDKPESDSVDLLTVSVERFAVPLIDAEENRLGYVWVDLVFEVDGPENQSYVSAHLPELRDAYLRDLHTRQTTREDRPGALDFELLKNRLQAVAEDTLGQDRVLAVRIVNARPAPG